MQNKFILVTLFLFFICSSLVFARPPSASGAYVYIISPVHGETVTSPVVVKFGLRGMGVAPAGADIKNTGHHHLLINVDKLPDLNKPIPADDNHLHFGKGQTETVIELSPGTHTLQLLLANFAHIPHEPAVKSQPITITVAE